MDANDPTWLRDMLAIDRTILANERTLLAYGRTLLALLAAGLTVGHFVAAWWAVPIAVGLVVVGIVVFGFGYWRYRAVTEHLARARFRLGSPVGPNSQ